MNSSQSTVKHSTYVKNELKRKFDIMPYRINDEYIEYNLSAAYNSLFNKSVRSKWVIEDRQYAVIQDEGLLNFAREVVEYANTLNYVDKCVFIDKQSLTSMSPYNPNSVGTLIVRVNAGVMNSEIDPYNLYYVTLTQNKTSSQVWDTFVNEVVKQDPYHYFIDYGYSDAPDKIVFIVEKGEFGIQDNYSAVNYIKSVFKGQYGGYMADVRSSKPTMKWAKKYYEMNK